MSTTAIDTARTTERLSAFKSEIVNSDPVDNYFPKLSALPLLMENKEVGSHGRQLQITIDSGKNPTIKDFSDVDVFDTSRPDTVLTLVYPMVNKGGTIVISWEEMREIAGKDHKIFDLVKNRRRNILKAGMDALATDLFAATQDASKISSLVPTILGTGSVGGLSQSTDSDWASTATASGSFAAQGQSDMRTLYNTIVNAGAIPDTIVTTQSIYEFYEKDIDPDVRYSSVQGAGSRGWKTLEFKGIPVIHDLKCTSGVLYMITSDNLKFYIDSEGNWDVDDFIKPHNQKAFTATVVFRGQLATDRRKSHGKLTGITA